MIRRIGKLGHNMSLLLLGKIVFFTLFCLTLTGGCSYSKVDTRQVSSASVLAVRGALPLVVEVEIEPEIGEATTNGDIVRLIEALITKQGLVHKKPGLAGDYNLLLCRIGREVDQRIDAEGIIVSRCEVRDPHSGVVLYESWGNEHGFGTIGERGWASGLAILASPLATAVISLTQEQMRMRKRGSQRAIESALSGISALKTGEATRMKVVPVVIEGRDDGHIDGILIDREQAISAARSEAIRIGPVLHANRREYSRKSGTDVTKETLYRSVEHFGTVASLVPGYKIEDRGYGVDGYYVVTLKGHVRVVQQ